MNPTTESELVFERYLEGQSLRYSRFPDSQSKHPDYVIEHQGVRCLLEVKEFGHPEKAPVGGSDPCPPIRRKIAEAARQLEGHGEHSGGIVLWSSKSIYRSVFLDVVAPSAFGRYVSSDPLSTGPLRAEPPTYRFSGPATLTAYENTSVSAIVILSPYVLNHLHVDVWREMLRRQQGGEEVTAFDQFNLLNEFSQRRPLSYSYEGTIRAVVIDNPYARIPLPSDLFAGPFDQRWSAQSGSFGLAFMGSELARLKEDGVPFIYL